MKTASIFLSILYTYLLYIGFVDGKMFPQVVLWGWTIFNFLVRLCCPANLLEEAVAKQPFWMLPLSLLFLAVNLYILFIIPCNNMYFAGFYVLASALAYTKIIQALK